MRRPPPNRPLRALEWVGGRLPAAVSPYMKRAGGSSWRGRGGDRLASVRGWRPVLILARAVAAREVGLELPRRLTPVGAALYVPGDGKSVPQISPCGGALVSRTKLVTVGRRRPAAALLGQQPPPLARPALMSEEGVQPLRPAGAILSEALPQPRAVAQLVNLRRRQPGLRQDLLRQQQHEPARVEPVGVSSPSSGRGGAGSAAPAAASAREPSTAVRCASSGTWTCCGSAASSGSRCAGLTARSAASWPSRSRSRGLAAASRAFSRTPVSGSAVTHRRRSRAGFCGSTGRRSGGWSSGWWPSRPRAATTGSRGCAGSGSTRSPTVRVAAASSASSATTGAGSFWQRLRRQNPDQAAWLKGTRFVLRCRADSVSEAERTLIDELAATNEHVYRGWLLCGQLRAVYHAEDAEQATRLLREWLRAAQASLLAPFIPAAATIADHSEAVQRDQAQTLKRPPGSDELDRAPDLPPLPRLPPTRLPARHDPARLRQGPRRPSHVNAERAPNRPCWPCLSRWSVRWLGPAASQTASYALPAGGGGRVSLLA